LNNKTKDLQFLPENSLTFIFQPNIIQNPNIEKYSRWFRFAERSKNVHNKSNDFADFAGDPIFDEVIHRLGTGNLQPDEIKEYEDEVETATLFNEFMNKTLKQGEEIGIKKGEEIGIKKGEEIGEQKAMFKIALNLLKSENNINKIHTITDLPTDVLLQIQKLLSVNNQITVEEIYNTFELE